ncbi:RluA family pseudouridine synthase [Cyanobacterium aponinum]|uniref:RluA family pseudouridine synthase n=1 Tax=Cyanobacterium aponinum TaxID=379064 RepID=UPI000C12ACE0|nr:RluA family pseudouridine synthase [Cyanobacterium aponinum]PHV63169.1 RNA pseudouridine synthase [Cyanobacterium aponinum IPPAS B-1201]
MNLQTILHSVDDFVKKEDIFQEEIVTYHYEGFCPKTKQKLTLPRTILSEKIALKLCAELDKNEIKMPKGKMLGVLIVKDNLGDLKVIKAFSGFWGGKKEIRGWVNQIPANSVITMAEKLTLQKLDQIKYQIIALENISVREEYNNLEQKFQQEWQSLKKIHQARKQVRHELRNELKETIINNSNIEEKFKILEQESRKDDWQRRNLKHKWQEILQPLKDKISLADQEIRNLKRQRKELSRQLQAQMQTAYSMTNFAGESLSVGSLLGKDFIPTGTGDCCAPKLLHYAATNNLIPIAMAEVWWGDTSPNGEKVNGHFYPACESRCQPLMGFLLSGLPSFEVRKSSANLPIIYEDDYLLVVNKPSGLLSVSGRGIDKFDCVEARFRQILTTKSHNHLKTVHRLDQDTSGILILAKDEDTHLKMSQLFAAREVKKIYEAVVEGMVKEDRGIIDLPLWGNPRSRPRQEVNYQYGKPSVTHFRVIERRQEQTRLELIPITGRTHQLRVHCLQGLGMAIRGDRIYGKLEQNEDRLYLHAREIIFTHPHTQTIIHLTTKTPF